MKKEGDINKSSDSKGEQKSETEIEKEVIKENKVEKTLNKKEKLKEELRALSKEDLINKIIRGEDKTSELSKKTVELKEDIDEWKDKYMRLQAEFENSQKRWDKARKSLMNQSIANVLRNFLPLYDSFHSAIKNMESDNPVIPFYKQFMNILKSYEAHPLEIKEGDKFDYDKHEALSSVEKEDLPNNSIIDVIQKGWKFKDDVLRYAKVIISRKPKPPAPSKPSEQEEKKDDDEEKNKEKIKEKKEEPQEPSQ